MGWEGVFLMAYEAGQTNVEPWVAAPALVSLAQLDRGAIDIARLHMLGHVLDRPEDVAGHSALRCIAAALALGDEGRGWRAAVGHVDPWAAAQHRLASDRPT